MNTPASRLDWAIIAIYQLAIVGLVSRRDPCGAKASGEVRAGFTLIRLLIFFSPHDLRSRVATLPDFLERRFNRHHRDVLAVVSLFSALVVHMGVALFTAAYVSPEFNGDVPIQ